MAKALDTQAPVRRAQRKADRMDDIVEAAAALFATDGFTRTSVADVSRRVGTTASALYRHVAGKEQLLALALDRRFADYETPLRTCRDWEDVAARLAPVAIEHRDLGVLWQREGAHLTPETYAALADRLRAVARGIAALAPGQDGQVPSLARAWATISVLTSLSYHSETMSRPRLTLLLHQLIDAVGQDRVAAAEPPSFWYAPGQDGGPDDLEPPPVPGDVTDRRIIDAAGRLFGERGSHAVSMADLGAAAGMAGPSIYHRYESKASVLVAVLERSNSRLLQAADWALGESPNAWSAMRALVGSYARLVVFEPHVVQALLREVPQLPDGQRHSAMESHERYVRVWARQLRRLDPALSGVEAKVRVHASMTILHDLSRTRSTRDRISFDEVCGLAWSVLADEENGAENTSVDAEQEVAG